MRALQACFIWLFLLLVSWAMLMVVLVGTSKAAPVNGVQLIMEPETGYRAVEGTRREGPVSASLGFVKNGNDKGLHLTLGPRLGSNFEILYGAGAMYVGETSLAMFHEAQAVLKLWAFSAGVGRAWDGGRLQAPQGSGLGERVFVRLGLGIEL